MNADVLTQTRDLVLHLQLAALEFGDPQVIGRWMCERFTDLVFQGLMAPFEFRKVRLNGHVACLLWSDWCLTRKVYTKHCRCRRSFDECIAAIPRLQYRENPAKSARAERNTLRINEFAKGLGPIVSAHMERTFKAKTNHRVLVSLPEGAMQEYGPSEAGYQRWR